MRTRLRCATALFAALAGMYIVSAPVAAPTPQCTNISPNTTQCQTNGSAQIVTSPPVVDSWVGWPWWGGGLVITLGGWGH
ncbi:hypothetical protein [Mycolicibacterium sp. XJ1819]